METAKRNGCSGASAASLLANLVASFGINYLPHLLIAFYCLLSFISVVALAPRPAPAPQLVDAIPPDSLAEAQMHWDLQETH